MGKPRMIIVIRHAQSEGNKNREIHQKTPDHRVKLTAEGWAQADEAGRRLRSMLRPDDTLQVYTSPYRRTRETTEGILTALTADEPTPSPFRRQAIKVWEEPRLREQDFGNFQPSSADMERMWRQRADYGHFFFRIPDGESAADAYDRVSGFNESLWRSFGDADFPSVCVLVTHGLMTRVFLMKWYHWSVEYFEDLRNINHCEFIIMLRNRESDKYDLQNQLRTWSELKRARVAETAETLPHPVQGRQSAPRTTPSVPRRRQWGGAITTGDQATYETMRPPPGTSLDHSHHHGPSFGADQIVPATGSNPDAQPPTLAASSASGAGNNRALRQGNAEEDDDEAFPYPLLIGEDPDHESASNAFVYSGGNDGAYTSGNDDPSPNPVDTRLVPTPRPAWAHKGRDFGGTESGASSSAEDDLAPTNNGRDSNVRRTRHPTIGEGSQSAASPRARADALGDHEEDGETSDSSLAEAEEQDKSIRGSVY